MSTRPETWAEPSRSLRRTSPRLTSVLPAARRRDLRADLLIAAFWASNALALGLYVASGEAKVPTTSAAALTFAGISAGLIGTNMVMIMLLLAARIPVLDHTIGHDRALLWHQKLGKWAFYLILAHVVALTLGYAMADGSNLVAETLTLLGAPDFLLAYLAAGLLLAVTITSLLAIRKRLHYETWHVVHLASYLMVLAAFPYELSAGGILAVGTWQRLYWWTLLLAVLAALTIFRLILPMARSLRLGLRVENVIPAGQGAFHIVLRGPGLPTLQVRGGQFAIWRFFSGSLGWQTRPLSFSSVPYGDRVRITVAVAGRGTAALQRVRPGTRVWMEGPYGIFSTQSRTRPRVTIMAAGIGITPALSILHDPEAELDGATLVIRASDSSLLPLLNEAASAAAMRSVRFVGLYGRRSLKGRSWLPEFMDQTDFSEIVPEPQTQDLYLCGPQGWVDAVAAEARRNGMQSEQIHTERFEL